MSISSTALQRALLSYTSSRAISHSVFVITIIFVQCLTPKPQVPCSQCVSKGYDCHPRRSSRRPRLPRRQIPRSQAPQAQLAVSGPEMDSFSSSRETAGVADFSARYHVTENAGTHDLFDFSDPSFLPQPMILEDSLHFTDEQIGLHGFSQQLNDGGSLYGGNGINAEPTEVASGFHTLDPSDWPVSNSVKQLPMSQEPISLTTSTSSKPSKPNQHSQTNSLATSSTPDHPKPWSLSSSSVCNAFPSVHRQAPVSEDTGSESMASSEAATSPDVLEDLAELLAHPGLWQSFVCKCQDVEGFNNGSQVDISMQAIGTMATKSCQRVQETAWSHPCNCYCTERCKTDRRP